jgi:ABC-type branched-subunit amino acid transport system ATPase component
VTSAPAKLAVKGLNAAYGRARILYDVALEVGANEAVGLVGRNGAGKSTTLRSILGLVANCDGEIVFDGEPIAHGRLGGRMSGGEQQMLAIARTLMGNPSLVLLDEPSEGLAPKIVEQMIEAILAMKREGLSLLLSEQNLRFARLVADRVCVIEKGRVRFSGTTTEFDARPDIRDAYLAL